jgi:GT2 family glycosyltransferase
MPKNLGYVMAYNLAMPNAFADGCEWVIWANNDVLLEAGCLSELNQAVASDSCIGVAGPAFLSWSGNEANYYMKGKCPDLIPAMRAHSSIPVDVDWVEGSFLMVNRDIAETVGPLNPHFFIFWEEADFCRRVRYLGKRVVMVPSAQVRHYGGAFSEGRRDTWRDGLHSRNYYIYTLTDPSLSFARNIMAALHLFAANIKAAAKKSRAAVLLELRSFLTVSMKVGVWRQKWANDRRRIPPAPLDLQNAGARPEILVSSSYEATFAK